MKFSEAVRHEFSRIRRVSDMMITMHLKSAEDLRRFCFWTDLILMAISAYLAAVAFADDQIATKLMFVTMSPKLYLGLLGLVSFLIGIGILLADLRGKIIRHSKAAEFYTAIKMRCNAIVVKDHIVDLKMARQIVLDYSRDVIAQENIVDGSFLELKRKHLLKIFISKILDRWPGTSLLALRINIYFRHTKKALMAAAARGEDKDE